MSAFCRRFLLWERQKELFFFVVVALCGASRLFPELHSASHFPNKTRLYLAVKKKKKIKGDLLGNKGGLGLSLGTPEAEQVGWRCCWMCPGVEILLVVSLPGSNDAFPRGCFQGKSSSFGI